jgi:lipoate-protein ligase A
VQAVAWHLLIEATAHPGAENMAIDEGLLLQADRTGDAFLRLYRWDPPCLSFGRNEPAAARYDRPGLERRALAVVRRPTGGRAVWHEHEVTYAVAAPIDMFGSLRESYGAIHSRLAAALRSLGADATLASDRPSAHAPVRHGPCFASPAGGEVLVNGRKVIGSAQVRHGSALLQHGSILLDGSQDIVRELSCQPSALGHQGETTLREALGRAVTFDEVAEAVVRHWTGAVVPAAARPHPTAAAFADPAWTWRR